MARRPIDPDTGEPAVLGTGVCWEQANLASIRYASMIRQHRQDAAHRQRDAMVHFLLCVSGAAQAAFMIYLFTLWAS